MQQKGMWSNHWAKSAVAWEAHVERGHDAENWSKPIYLYRGRGWLDLQRVQAARGSTLNRTETRSGPGRPATRWFEGAFSAHQLLRESGGGS